MAFATIYSSEITSNSKMLHLKHQPDILCSCALLLLLFTFQDWSGLAYPTSVTLQPTRGGKSRFPPGGESCSPCREGTFGGRTTSRRAGRTHIVHRMVEGDGCPKCRPCRVCPAGRPPIVRCSSTSDTVCTSPRPPRCPDNDTSCHKLHLVLEDLPTSPPSTNTTPPTDSVDRSCPGCQPGHRRDINDEPSLDNEAWSEKNSPAYLVSLFVNGAAIVSVFILVIVFAIYLSLRIKQWRHDRSV